MAYVYYRKMWWKKQNSVIRQPLRQWIATFIEQQKIKINLNRRVAQINNEITATISDPENKLDNRQFFCYNRLGLSWEKATNNLAARLEITSYAFLPISWSEEKMVTLTWPYF